MDVKTAFLNGYLEGTIYIDQPEGYIEKGLEQKVCKLQRSIYGLKQTSRSWNIGFDEAIKSYGFDQNQDVSNERKEDVLILYKPEYMIFSGSSQSLLVELKI